MTAIDITTATTGERSAPDNRDHDDRSPNLAFEYAMIATGALLVAFAVVLGCIATR